jgi:hypothetical protein
MVEVQSWEVGALLALLNSGMGLFSIVGFPLLYHIPYLADVTVDIKACTLPKVVKLCLIQLNK